MLMRVHSQGGCSIFQIVLHKNLNAYHRINGVPNHTSIQVTPRKALSCVYFILACVDRAHCSL